MGAAASAVERAQDGEVDKADAEEETFQLQAEIDSDLHDEVNDDSSQPSALPDHQRENYSGGREEHRSEQKTFEHVFQPTAELFGQWNIDCVEAIISCEEDFALTKHATQGDEANILPPRSAITMDSKLRSFLLRIHQLHASSHKVVSNVERVTRHTSHVTRHTSHATRHTSHVTRHTPHVTRHTSHVTRHTSRVTRHTGSVNC